MNQEMDSPALAPSPSPSAAPDDCWIVTSTGRQLNLLSPDPAAIEIEDIATALSRAPRFAGHTLVPYSVAQHSVLVSHVCESYLLAGDEQYCLAALLHDAHEAYIGDISRPLKRAINLVAARLGNQAWRGRQLSLHRRSIEPDLINQIDVIGAIGWQFDLAICQRFNLPVGIFQSHFVKEADNVLLATEKRDLVIEHPHPWRDVLPEPLPDKIHALATPEAARNAFLARFHELDAMRKSRSA